MVCVQILRLDLSQLSQDRNVSADDWTELDKSRCVLQAAECAHPYYHELVERYDLKRGSVEPKAGLDARSREILAILFDQTLTGWAAVLDRVAALAMVEIPISPLTFTTVMAAVDVPLRGRWADCGCGRAKGGEGNFRRVSNNWPSGP